MTLYSELKFSVTHHLHTVWTQIGLALLFYDSYSIMYVVEHRNIIIIVFV